MIESVETQKRIWAQVLNGDADYSYSWGDPNSSDARSLNGDRKLGNYKHILEDILVPNIIGKWVLDLGSHDGKWTKHMVMADVILCADIYNEGFDVISKNIKHDGLFFYKTEGDELTGIADESVDFIFSMDSLVRSEKEVIRKYISEFKRILSPNGKMCIHLPAEDQKLSWELGFTQINSDEIKAMCDGVGLENVIIDKETINHGILLRK